MAIIGIVAVDLNNGIGYNKDLLFHIKEDLVHFKNCTKNHTVVMGHNTLKSLPGMKPLPDRTNIVLSSKAEIDNCVNVHSLDELLSYIKTIDDDIYIIGGAQLYTQMLPYYDKLIITKVYAEKPADTFFPNIDNQLKIVDKSDIIKTALYDI